MKDLERDKLENSDNDKHKKAAQNARSKSILESFEHIVELAAGSNLDDDFFKNASRHIKYAARKLKLSPVQVVLLAIFVDNSEDFRIQLSEIALYAGCRTTRMLRLSGNIDALEQKGYLRAIRCHNSVSYRVPKEALDALRMNQPFVKTHINITDTQEFFDRFAVLMREKAADELTHEALLMHTRELLEEIRSTRFSSSLRGYELAGDDMLMLVYMAHLFVENNDDNIMYSDIGNIYDDNEIPGRYKLRLRYRSSKLFVKGLIENVNEDGMARSDAFKLTAKAKEELLGELHLNRFGSSHQGLISPDTLIEKKLIYNPAEQSQIAELSSILSEARFNDVQTRLHQAGMRLGFCCMFYGAPGTGKTETAYQIARVTGRSIMRVDVDKIKSCWVGESEKNIKALFDRYRNICKNSKPAPILLFNEADAVLGVRMEGASKAVDKMENSIQNIILQEMESLEGIMIATTNLTTNLDKAFERRFLYKIRFDKPTLQARTQIWLTMLPGLTPCDAESLAARFDLSGGEIENIARKHSINAILTGSKEVVLDDLVKSCLQERIDHTVRTRIGF